jgi:hypothetical protein
LEREAKIVPGLVRKLRLAGLNSSALDVSSPRALIAAQKALQT